jgi:hypothetical protein
VQRLSNDPTVGRLGEPFGPVTPRPTAIVIGRERELDLLQRELVEVPVAVICGVAGIGKTTLALEFASRRGGACAYVKASPGWTVGDVAEASWRHLRASRWDESETEAGRLEAALTALDREGRLTILEDVHLLAPSAAETIVDAALQRLRSARLIVTSRDLIPLAAGKPDRLQILLQALDRRSAEILWNRLVELYGQGRAFETAWQRSLGNPFLLRQAHAAIWSDGNPLDSAVADLASDELRLAAALAMSHTPLPAPVLARLLSGHRFERALCTLLTRLIVSVTADGWYSMHDLWREAVARALARETARSVAADLVAALRSGGVDATTALQEIARHLRQLGREAEIGPLLLEQAPALVRRGDSAALLREIEQLPPPLLGPELLVLRARTRARNMQVRRAHRELAQLVESGEVTPQVRFFLGSLATVAGELDHAQTLLAALVDDPQAGDLLRIQARLGLAWNAATRGERGEARRLLEEYENTSPRPQASSAALHLFFRFLDQDSKDTAELDCDPLGWMRDRSSDLWSRMITPVIAATILASQGRFEEADAVARWFEGSIHSPDTCVEWSWIQAMIRFEKGERAGPLGTLRRVQPVLDSGGHLAGAVYTRALTARLLFLLGRRREALVELGRAQDECAIKKAHGFRAILESVALEDPLAPGWLAHAPVIAPTKVGDAARARVKAALRMVVGGRPAVCGSRLPGPEVPPSDDYAFERALVDLAGSLWARRHGRERVEATCLARAAKEAVRGGADEDLIPRLHEALLELTVAGDRADRAPDSPMPLVIDSRRHEVRGAGYRTSLAQARTLRDLLYAFAAAPDHHLTRDLIARALWNTDYAPLRHESSLKSSIRRLRALLAGTELEVKADRAGYRLLLPSHAVLVVEPLTPGRDGPPGRA